MGKQCYEERIKRLKDAIYRIGQEFDENSIIKILSKEIEKRINSGKVTIDKIFLIELLNPNSKITDAKESSLKKDRFENHNNIVLENKENSMAFENPALVYFNLYDMATKNKMSELQALILDLANADYNGNLKVLKVEKWMVKLVNELKVFGCNELFFRKIIKQLLNEICDIFLGENKFGDNGNLLVADLIYLKKFTERIVKENGYEKRAYNNDRFRDVIDKFHNHIHENKRMEIERIENSIKWDFK